MLARIEAYVILALLAVVGLTWWGSKAYYYHDGYKDGLVVGAAPYVAESAKAEQQHGDTQKLLDSAATDREAMEKATAALRAAALAAAGGAKQPVKVVEVFPAGCVTSKAVVEETNNARH